MPVSIKNIPLRIAFFGSDHFSCYALEKLHHFATQSQLVEDIHVVTRSVKPTGRKLKQLIDHPITPVASSLSIPIHRVDRAKDFLKLQSYNFNMAIAVSFGRLIPHTFLQDLQFGGINVHPSLLPKYSGPSPIQYALMNDDKTTGVTVQTLHPFKFDGGDLLLQSKKIEIDPKEVYFSLEAKLGRVGGDMLVQTLQEQLYINPTPVKSEYPLSTTKKILSKDAEIKWDSPSRMIKRLNDALGRTFTWKKVDVKKKKLKQVTSELHRVILEDIQAHSSSIAAMPGGYIYLNGRLFVQTEDGSISVGKIKQQYYGLETAEGYSKRCGNQGSFQSFE